MAVTLETILCHPGAFGLVTASPMQRACCRIADGLPLGDLADDPVVVKCLGGAEAIRALPTVPPLELYLLAAIRAGKSLFTGALAIHTALTASLSSIGPDELPNVVIVSLDKYRAKVVMRFMMAALQKKGGLLNDFLVRRPKPTNESFQIRRPDGRLVEVIVAAGKRGGDNLVSRWTLAVVFDEAARMLGQEDGVVNFDDMRSAVIERIRLLRDKGTMARLVAVSSPWAARGPIDEAVTAHFGKPTEHLVIIRATGPDLCPYNWTPEAVEASRNAPGSSYENDVMGAFADSVGGWLTAAEVRNATRDLGDEVLDEDGFPAGLEREHGATYSAAIDPAVSGNAWTLVVVGRRQSETGEETKDKFFVALAKQWQGSAAKPLKARAIFAEMRPLLKEYRLSEVASDKWSGALMAELGDYAGVTVDVSRDTPADTARQHADFRTLLVDGRLELAPHRVLLADLLSKRKKLLPGGRVSYPAPVTRDGRHADFADAAVLAVARASGGAGWVDAMNRVQRGQVANPFA